MVMVTAMLEICGYVQVVDIKYYFAMPQNTMIQIIGFMATSSQWSMDMLQM